MIIFSLFLLTYLNLVEAGASCAAETDLKVCTCSQKIKLDSPKGTLAAEYNLTVLECQDIKSLNDFESDLSKFQFKVIDKLIVRNVSPASLRRKSTRFLSTTFKNTRIRMIEILDSQLSGDFSQHGDPFKDQTSLISLTVRNCSLKGALLDSFPGSVTTRGLQKLLRIESIDFSDNYLTFVSNSAFSNFPRSLTSVDLSKNEIDKVEYKSFEKVSRLQVLNLSHNVLEKIERNVFPYPAGSLEILDLGFNSLKELPDDLFISMPVLEIVNLENNYLHTVSDRTWTAVWSQLVSLDLSGNVIDCDCSLVWMLKAKSAAERTIKGKCVTHQFPFSASEYELQSLTRAQITCSS